MKNNIRTSFRRIDNKQKGFSLLEVLITVVIIAIGSLGIAALQIAGLNYSSGSYGRTQATILADDMMNRLKANRNTALDIQISDGSLGTNFDQYEIPDFGTTVTTTKDCLTDACSPNELATYDKSVWLDEVARALPSGQGRVISTPVLNVDGQQDVFFTIDLQWRQTAQSTDEDDTDEDNQIKEFSFTSTL